MAQPFDVVGYMYRADLYCPDHIVSQLTVNPGDTGHRDAAIGDTEGHLDILARINGVDRTDERSFDSGDFPKVIFRDQVSSEDDADEDQGIAADRCGVCHELLADVYVP